MTALIAAFLSAFAAAQIGAAQVKPNIVVFLTDDQSQLDSTPYGSRALRTPNMQRLADEGMGILLPHFKHGVPS